MLYHYIWNTVVAVVWALALARLAGLLDTILGIEVGFAAGATFASIAIGLTRRSIREASNAFR